MPCELLKLALRPTSSTHGLSRNHPLEPTLEHVVFACWASLGMRAFSRPLLARICFILFAQNHGFINMEHVHIVVPVSLQTRFKSRHCRLIVPDLPPLPNESGG
mmetsp:Transcript_17499/g.28314  ORF Transcript_17499/g.28314 Transcript_17499/m.28314 type:complete len:104 (+) Transcript_17499:2027-2338(+)